MNHHPKNSIFTDHQKKEPPNPTVQKLRNERLAWRRQVVLAWGGGGGTNPPLLGREGGEIPCGGEILIYKFWRDKICATS